MCLNNSSFHVVDIRGCLSEDHSTTSLELCIWDIRFAPSLSLSILSQLCHWFLPWLFAIVSLLISFHAHWFSLCGLTLFLALLFFFHSPSHRLVVVVVVDKEEEKEAEEADEEEGEESRTHSLSDTEQRPRVRKQYNFVLPSTVLYGGIHACL